MFRRLTYLRLPDVIIKIEFTTLTASARAAIKTYTTKHSTTKNWSIPIKQIRPIKIKPYQNNTTNQLNTKTPLKSSKKLKSTLSVLARANKFGKNPVGNVQPNDE